MRPLSLLFVLFFIFAFAQDARDTHTGETRLTTFEGATKDSGTKSGLRSARLPSDGVIRTTRGPGTRTRSTVTPMPSVL